MSPLSSADARNQLDSQRDHLHHKVRVKTSDFLPQSQSIAQECRVLNAYQRVSTQHHARRNHHKQERPTSVDALPFESPYNESLCVQFVPKAPPHASASQRLLQFPITGVVNPLHQACLLDRCAHENNFTQRALSQQGVHLFQMRVRAGVRQVKALEFGPMYPD